MRRDVLQLGSFRFPVQKDEATIHGYISNATDYKLIWNIHIQCEEADVLIDGNTDRLKPMVYLQGMEFPFRDWRKVVGQTVRRSSEGKVEPACLYIDIWGHDDLTTSEIHFVSQHGVWFGVEWKFIWGGTGGTGSYAGELRTMVKFTEITIWLDEVDTEAKARQRLEQDLDLSFFDKPKRLQPYPDHGPQFKFLPIP